MRIFAEGDLSAALQGQLSKMQHEVDSEPKNRLLNVNKVEYVDYLVQTYAVDPLEFAWNDVTVTDREAMIPAERFPQMFDVYAGKSYPRQVITYHLQFRGEPDLLKMTPSTRLLWSTDVGVSNGSVTFDVVSWRDDPEEITRQANDVLSNIRRQSEYVSSGVKDFNERLPAAAQAVVEQRKKQHLQQSSLLESLGVPVKRSNRTPETFAVPTVKRRVVVKPSSPDAAYAPEPTLDTSLYTGILQLCRDAGIEMERHPRIYADKDEETLRDHFIMVLSPHFDSVTGETFNRSGKTDILVRHETANAFVAECKFWSGAQAFIKTIDQVLSYLTWRDSKAAIVLFVRNKQLDPVLDQIAPSAERHSCYVSTAASNGEGWDNFNFHLLNDHTRGVRLAVLCFHLPPQ
jgi:hypothetical protein